MLILVQPSWKCHHIVCPSVKTVSAEWVFSSSVEQILPWSRSHGCSTGSFPQMFSSVLGPQSHCHYPVATSTSSLPAVCIINPLVITPVMIITYVLRWKRQDSTETAGHIRDSCLDPVVHKSLGVGSCLWIQRKQYSNHLTILSKSFNHSEFLFP